MAKQLTSKWRESASVIILARDKLLPSTSHNYKALLFNRHEKASFMPNSSVFPGGVQETVDSSPLWLDYFKSCGISDNKICELLDVGKPRPDIFSKENAQGSNLQKEISLRITALRETFEEVGIFLGRDCANLQAANPLGFCHIYEDFDRVHWQSVVHKDPAKFLTLCQELNAVPDLWSLHEWSAWLTPSNFKRRFLTMFYVAALPAPPELVAEKNEVKDFAWKTPQEYLKSYANKELWLPPPQLYELSRLLNMPDLEKVAEFARQRSKEFGITLMLPVQYECTDGEVSIYPGDDGYPENPNSFSEKPKTNCTLEEFRAGVKKQHRTEFYTLYNAVLRQNFQPADGHLKVVNQK